MDHLLFLEQKPLAMMKCVAVVLRRSELFNVPNMLVIL
jgi:hypothetical protein